LKIAPERPIIKAARFVHSLVSPRCRRRSLVLVAAMIMAASGHRMSAEESSAVVEGPSAQQRRVQTVADDFKVRLGLTQAVDVVVVPANTLLLSVEPVENSSLRRFDLRVEEDFIEGLTDVELSAAVAHELGHVWIFTHHPFLQTEQLANDIAMRLVSRDALTSLYDKVWKKQGTKGDLAKYLSPQITAGLAPPKAR